MSKPCSCCMRYTYTCPFLSALAWTREEQESELGDGALVCQGLNLNFLTKVYRSGGKA